MNALTLCRPVSGQMDVALQVVANQHVDQLRASSHFCPSAFEQVESLDPDSTTLLLYMAPAEFLAVAKAGHSEEKATFVAALFDAGVAFNSLPFLNFVHDGEGTAQVVGHEGRHRAKVLLASGVALMPVLLKHVYDRNGQYMRWQKLQAVGHDGFMDEWPSRLYQESPDGGWTSVGPSNFIAFPVQDPRV